MSTYRLSSDKERVATAVLLNDGRVLQVFPKKEIFETQSTWVSSYPQTLTLQVASKDLKAKTKKVSVQEKRLGRELMEFFDPSYAWMFKTVEIHGIPKIVVKVTLIDDSQWEVERDLDFLMHSPSLKKNGVLIQGTYDWYPCLTTIRWLMMNAFLESED
jgi:hypothetical protein